MSSGLLLYCLKRNNDSRRKEMRCGVHGVDAISIVKAVNTAIFIKMTGNLSVLFLGFDNVTVGCISPGY